MADVLISTTCLVSAVGGYSIGMFRTELLTRKDEALFDGYWVFKVVHLKEKTLIGHEFFAVYLRNRTEFLVVRIERRPGSPKGSSSDLWTDDSISRLHSNFDFRKYYHLSTTFCDTAKRLTILGLCDLCADIRHAAPLYSVTKHKHCYWFCAAFLVQLSALAYADPSSLGKGTDYDMRGRFRGTRFVTEESARKDLTTGTATSQPQARLPTFIHQLNPFRKHFHPHHEHWELERELTGHKNQVNSVCFTPDGKHILSASHDHTIRTWDVNSGKDARRPLTGHLRAVTSVAISPDGHYFVSASLDKTVRIWDLEAGTAATEPLTGHTGAVSSVAFSPDGFKIVSGSRDNSLRIWDAKTGAAIGEPLLGNTRVVHSVAWSPDGRHIASGSADGTIKVWDVGTGAIVGEPLRGNTHRVISVSFYPDGHCIVSAGGVVQLWDTASGQALSKPFPNPRGSAKTATFSPCGHWIASASADGTVSIWESTSDGAEGETVSLDAVYGVNSVAWSPTGERIAAGCDDGMVRVWCKVCIHTSIDRHELVMRDCSVAWELNHFQTAARRNPFNHRAFRTALSHVIPFGASSMQWVPVFIDDPQLDFGRPEPASIFRALCFTPDGRHILCGGDDNKIWRWDTVTAKMDTHQTAAPEGHIVYMESLVVSPDGYYVVSTSPDNSVHIWDLATCTAVTEPLRGHTSRVVSAMFSPDGSKIVSGSADKSLRMWDVKTGAAIGEPLLGHTEGVTSVAWSPDGRHIVSGSYDKTIRVWDAQTGAPVGAPLLGHTGHVHSVFFSTKSSHFVSGSEDGTLRIWDTARRRSVGEPLRGHTQPVQSVAFSPDGRLIASGSWDGTVRIWRSDCGGADGEVVVRLDAQSRVTAIAWSPLGDVIAAGCTNGIRLWRRTDA